MGERAGVSLSQHEISVLHGPRRMTAAWTCHGPNDHQILERTQSFVPDSWLCRQLCVVGLVVFSPASKDSIILRLRAASFAMRASSIRPAQSKAFRPLVACRPLAARHTPTVRVGTSRTGWGDLPAARPHARSLKVLAASKGGKEGQKR